MYAYSKKSKDVKSDSVCVWRACKYVTIGPAPDIVKRIIIFSYVNPLTPKMNKCFLYMYTSWRGLL